MVPQLMLKIGNITQMRVQLAHNINDGAGNFVALFTIGNGNGKIDHFLNISAVFGDDHPGLISIVFHVIVLVVWWYLLLLRDFKSSDFIATAQITMILCSFCMFNKNLLL